MRRTRYRNSGIDGLIRRDSFSDLLQLFAMENTVFVTSLLAKMFSYASYHSLVGRRIAHVAVGVHEVCAPRSIELYDIWTCKARINQSHTPYSQLRRRWVITETTAWP